MSKRQKRLERLRQNPNNVSIDELRAVLKDYGFEYRQTVGSHFTFRYTLNGETKAFTLPFHRPIKAIYVKRAIQIIDAIVREQDEDERDED